MAAVRSGSQESATCPQSTWVQAHKDRRSKAVNEVSVQAKGSQPTPASHEALRPGCQLNTPQHPATPWSAPSRLSYLGPDAGGPVRTRRVDKVEQVGVSVPRVAVHQARGLRLDGDAALALNLGGAGCGYGHGIWPNT